jgi:pyruvate dehydrogenase E2 component (dihydrolipoamide acetyltransferase)
VVEVGSVLPVLGVVGYILKSGEPHPSGLKRASDDEKAGVVSVLPAQASLQPVSVSSGMASPAAKRRAKELNVDIQLVKGTAEGGRISVADVEAFAQAQVAAKASSGEIRASPLARRIAQSAGIDLAIIKGTGKDGSISKEDVEAAIAARQQIVAQPAPAVEIIPIKGVRAVISERMHASSQQTAPVTLTTEVDATAFVQTRQKLNEQFSEALGWRIAYNDILVKLAAITLQDFPYINARQEGDTIHLLKEINIGVAVDTERGLLVPVVRNADRLSITQISRELRALAERALAGKSQPDDLTDGTFTITNLGTFGIDAFTPIINLPQIAILGVGRINQKPVAYKGGIHLREQVYLSLTFDHRLVDGAPAARFLQRIGDLIQSHEQAQWE